MPCSTEELVKAGAYMADNLFDPRTGHSDEAADSPICQVFKTPKPYFDWLAEPGNEYRRNRFDVAMRGLHETESGDAILKGQRSAVGSHQGLSDPIAHSGFPWSGLSQGSKVVDVGGGIGSVSLTVALQFPHLKFVIQDIVTDQTEKVTQICSLIDSFNFN
jgi:hypothetical protein